MSRPVKIATRIGVAAAALVAILAVTAAIVAQTEWFRQFVKNKIITAAEDGTGGRVEIGTYEFDWKRLRSTISNFVIRGQEPADAPPYLRADRVQLDIRLFTSIHHLLEVTSLVIDRPQANIMVFPDGSTNVPRPKTPSASSQTPLETVVDLAIGRFALNDGRAMFASHQQRFNIQGNNLRMNLAFDTLTSEYKGTLLFQPIYVISGRNTPVEFAVQLPVIVGRNRVQLQNATITTARSKIAIDGFLENLRDPKVWAHVHGRIALVDLKTAADLPLADAASGAPAALDLDAEANVSQDAIAVSALHVTLGQSSVDASGTLKNIKEHPALAFRSKLALGELGRLAKLAARPNGSVLLNGEATLGSNSDYLVVGNIQANQVSFQEGTRRISDLNLTAAASVDPHVIKLSNLRLRAVGAEIRGDASLQELARYQMHGRVRALSLRAAAEALGYRQLPYEGTVAGPLDAAGDLKAPAGQNLTARANLTIAPGSKGIPVRGRLNAAYSQAADDLKIEDSYVALPHTRVTLNGSVNNELHATLSSTDLNDVFAAAPGSRAPASFAGGRITYTASVRGGFSSPRIAGHVSANHFQIQGRQFDKLDADTILAANEAALSNGSLARGDMQAQFSGAAGLRDWNPAPDRTLSGSASIQNGDLGDIVALSGYDSRQYAGTLSVSAHITGTIGNPRGSADLQATNGTLEGQPFDRIEARVDLTDQRIRIPNAFIETGAGRADLAVDFQHSRDSIATGQVHARLQSGQLDLAKLAALQQRRPNTGGLVQFTGEASGTLSSNGGDGKIQFLLTNVTADTSVRGLRAEGRSYGDLTANARTAGDMVSYNVASNFAGSNLKIDGSTKLTPEYPSNMDVSLSGLPVERVLELARRPDLRVKGRLSGMAHLSGTIDDPQGDLDADLVSGAIYDESLDRVHLSAKYRAPDVDIRQLQITSGASHVDLAARYTHSQSTWEAGDFQVRVNNGRFDLARMKTLQNSRPGFGGVLQITANGSGQIQTAEPYVRIRDLNADVKASGLSTQGIQLGDASLTANTSAGKLNFALDSNLAMASIHGQGTATLAGDYPMDAQLAFTDLAWSRVRTLLQVTQEPAGFEAVADGQISAHGPAKKTDMLGGALQLTRVQLNTVSRGPSPKGVLRSQNRDILLQNQGPIAATLDGGVIRIQTAHITGPQTDLQLSGTAPLNGDGVNLRAGGSANLALLRSLSPDIDSSGGITLAATVQGALNNPRIAGQIELHNGTVNYADFGNGLANANGLVQFNGNAATIRNLTAESGGGKLTLGGFVALRDGVRFGLRANALKVRVRLDPGVSIVADSNVNLSGTLQSSLLSGTVSVERIAYAPKTDLASILTRAPNVVETGTASVLDNMKLDIRVKSSNLTTIQSSLAENLNLDADLQVRGTAGHPGILGRITSNEGQLTLLGSTYTVDSGTIAFYNPLRIEPVLDMNLETQAKGVTVTLRVNGPIDNLKLSYTSDPPLQFQEIISLLAAGATPTSDPTLLANQPQRPAQSFQQMGESAMLGKAVADPIANRLQRVFGVSQFKIDPSFTSGSEVPQATLTLQQRIANNIMFTYVSGISDANAQTIRVEWTLSQRWAATAMRDQNGIVSVNMVYKRQVR